MPMTNSLESPTSQSKRRALFAGVSVTALVVAMVLGVPLRWPASASSTREHAAQVGTDELVAHVRLYPAHPPYPASGPGQVDVVHICAGLYDEKTGAETLTYEGGPPPSACTMRVMVQSTWWYTYGAGAIPAAGCRLTSPVDATCTIPSHLPKWAAGSPAGVLYTPESPLAAAYHLPPSSLCTLSATALAYFCTHLSPTPYPRGEIKS